MFGVNNIFITFFIVLIIIIEYISIIKGSLFFDNSKQWITADYKLYRVLRADEDPNVGLIAKDRFANKTVLSHVNLSLIHI